MGFLEDKQRQTVQSEKAAAYDQLVAEQAKKQLAESAYTEGAKEGLAAGAYQVLASAQPTPNIGNPANANVSNDEVNTWYQRTGQMPTMKDIEFMRQMDTLPSKNADQNITAGLAGQVGVA